MMRKAWLMTLRTTNQLGKLEMVVTAAFPFGRFGYFSFW